MSNTFNFFWGFSFGIIFIVFIKQIITYLLSRNSYWTGNWYEVIPEQHGMNKRIDYLKLVQVGNRVYGSAKRILPKLEIQRKWFFEGYTTEDQIIGFFYLKNKKVDPSSYIPTTLVRDKHVRTIFVWHGSYTWPAMTDAEGIMSGNLKTGIVWWQKHLPDEIVK